MECFQTNDSCDSECDRNRHGNRFYSISQEALDEKVKIFLSLIIFLTAGCVTYPPADFRPGVEDIKPAKKICIAIDLFSGEDSFGETDPPRYDNDFELRNLKSELKVYNLFTDCDNPLGNYSIGMISRVDYIIPKVFWATISMLTIGIVPFFTDQYERIHITREKTVVLDKNETNFEVLSLFLAGKAYDQNSESLEIYRTTLGRAIFAKEIANGIIQDLKKRGKI